MGGLTDFLKYSLKSTGARAKDRFSLDPKESLKGPIRPKKDLGYLEEDMQRLFVGAPDEPIAPAMPEKTLKSAESRAAVAEEQRRRRGASIASSQPLGRKTVLGG